MFISIQIGDSENNTKQNTYLPDLQRDGQGDDSRSDDASERGSRQKSSTTTRVKKAEDDIGEAEVAISHASPGRKDV